MSDLYKWLQTVAVERVDAIERHMLTHPQDYPSFNEASQALDAGMKKVQGDAVDLEARDALWVNYIGHLAVELYLAGARDGGRVYHAFTTGELPLSQPKEEHHE